MAIEFFNFGNNETYHFFQWVTEGGCGDLNTLIEETWKTVESSYDDRDTCCPLCHFVRDELAAILFSFLEEEDVTDVFPRRLCAPLLRHAIDSIDCGVVAEALLQRNGKWMTEQKHAEST